MRTGGGEGREETGGGGGVLTRVRAGQVVSGVGLFDDVLVDLRPLALRVTPEGRRDGEEQIKSRTTDG